MVADHLKEDVSDVVNLFRITPDNAPALLDTGTEFTLKDFRVKRTPTTFTHE